MTLETSKTTPAPAPSPTPAEHFALLTEYTQSGLLTSQELVQLAPNIFAGTDAALVPSIQAILPIRDINKEQFDEAFEIILSQRGLSRKPKPQEIFPIATVVSDGTTGTTPSPPTPPTSEETGAAEEIDSKLDSSTKESESESDIAEIVVICIDVSGSMESPFEVDDDVRTKDRTRLDGVKQCFYGFRDQTQGHKNGSKHLLGLISFSDKVLIHTYPTSNLDVFEDVIDDMESKGRTAIFEAISVACTKILGPASNQHTKADLRVLVLSDGLNNCNTINSQQALTALADVGAVCDCMILGDKKNNADDDLRRLVAASEGQCVQFTGLSDAYEALESPAMISLASRRNSEISIDRNALKKRMQSVSTLSKVTPSPIQKNVIEAPITTTTSNQLKVTSYISLDSNVTGLDFFHFEGTSDEIKQIGNGAVSNRIIKELKSYSQSPLSNMFLFPGITEDGSLSESIKVLMIGLNDHPLYKNHAWQINIDFPSNYPFSPPIFKCITPIYHYAVSANGQVCLDILKDTWSPAKTLKNVLHEFSDLIHDHKSLDPDCNYALRSWLSDLLRTSPEEYQIQAIRHTQENAKVIPSLPKLVGNDVYSLLV